MKSRVFVSKLNPKGALLQPSPPCEKYKCEHFAKCKTKLLACKAFAVYVTTGRVVSPRIVWDKKRMEYIESATIPTRAQYLKIYCEDDQPNTKRCGATKGRK